jgi:hypothetical protein
MSAESTGPVQKDGTQPILLAGGRYLAWARAAEHGGDGEFVRFDTGRGEVRSLTVPGLQPRGPYRGAQPHTPEYAYPEAQLAVDRRYGRVVIVDNNAVYILDPIRLVLLGIIPLPADPQERRSSSRKTLSAMWRTSIGQSASGRGRVGVCDPRAEGFAMMCGYAEHPTRRAHVCH